MAGAMTDAIRPMCSWELILTSITGLSIVCESVLMVSTIFRIGKHGDANGWQVLLSGVLSFWLAWSVLLGTLLSLVDGIIPTSRRWARIACFVLIAVVVLRIVLTMLPYPETQLRGPGLDPLPTTWERLLSAVGTIVISSAVIGYIFHYKSFETELHVEKSVNKNGFFRIAVVLSIVFQLVGLILYCEACDRHKNLDMLPALTYALLATLYGSILLVGLGFTRKPVVDVISLLIIASLNTTSLLYLPDQQKDDDRFFFGVLIAVCAVSVLLAGTVRRLNSINAGGL